jgi:hypothetical protein
LESPAELLNPFLRLFRVGRIRIFLDQLLVVLDRLPSQFDLLRLAEFAGLECFRLFGFARSQSDPENGHEGEVGQIFQHEFLESLIVGFLFRRLLLGSGVLFLRRLSPAPLGLASPLRCLLFLKLRATPQALGGVFRQTFKERGHLDVIVDGSINIALGFRDARKKHHRLRTNFRRDR